MFRTKTERLRVFGCIACINAGVLIGSLACCTEGEIAIRLAAMLFGLLLGAGPLVWILKLLHLNEEMPEDIPPEPMSQPFRAEGLSLSFLHLSSAKLYADAF